MANGIVKSKVGMRSMMSAEFLGTTSVPTKGRVGTGTSTPDEDQTELDTQVDNTDLTLGYPKVTTSGQASATVRWKLNTTDANGNTITEAASGATASGADIKERAVFDGVDKDSSTILDFVVISKLRNKV